jgi:hypothetical protein
MKISAGAPFSAGGGVRVSEPELPDYPQILLSRKSLALASLWFPPRSKGVEKHGEDSRIAR